MLLLLHFRTTVLLISFTSYFGYFSFGNLVTGKSKSMVNYFLF